MDAAMEMVSVHTFMNRVGFVASIFVLALLIAYLTHLPHRSCFRRIDLAFEFRRTSAGGHVVVGFSMTYIVNEACIRCKYTDCVEVCPVDCFYEGENMLVIHPD